MTALEGIRVLDFTHAHAGPMCAMGAEVIKIEPTWGEMTRMSLPLSRARAPTSCSSTAARRG